MLEPPSLEEIILFLSSSARGDIGVSVSSHPLSNGCTGDQSDPWRRGAMGSWRGSGVDGQSVLTGCRVFCTARLRRRGGAVDPEVREEDGARFSSSANGFGSVVLNFVCRTQEQVEAYFDLNEPSYMSGIDDSERVVQAQQMRYV